MIRREKNGDKEDLVIEGFEQGIQPSPHKGLAMIKNANLSTETGEVIPSFPRIQQTIQSTATGTGTLAYLSTDHVTLDIAGSNDLFKGNWITVTNSSHTGEVPNGTYYVPPSTGAGFKLANYYQVAPVINPVTATILVAAGGGAGGGVTAAGAGGGGGAGGVIATTTSVTTSGYIYPVVVGAGGIASTGTGGDGGSSSFDVTSVTGGGGGGTQGSVAGHNGGSGGGGGSTAGTHGTGIAGQGHDGADGTTNPFGGGGGGASTAASGTTAGTGLSSSISGGAVTYGVGGTGATSGTGSGANGSANTGNGGGGSGRGGAGSTAGGTGGSGVVIISIPHSAGVTAVGGTHTTSGGNDIWTFTASGSWTPTIPSTTPTNVLSGFTAGLTATIQLTAVLGKPIAKAVETYVVSGVGYNRYYILDNQNLVWVYDTFNETLYSASDNVSWFLPDYKTNWCTSASGIAVIDGLLVVAAQSGVYGKQVAMLGGINTQNSNWTRFSHDVIWNGSATTSPHFCYVGHQGYLYITDGNYIRSYFPDSTIADPGGSISGGDTVTTDNVQSFGSWTADTNISPEQFGIPSVISGSSPATADSGLLPVVLSTTGTLPLGVVAGTVYYMQYFTSSSAAHPGDFVIYQDITMDASQAETWNGSLSAGATSGTLSSTWGFATGYYYASFSTTPVETHLAYLQNGSASVTWSTPLANNAGTAVAFDNRMDLSTGTGTQYYTTFYPLATAPSWNGSTPTYVISPQRLALPNFELAQCMTEVADTLVIGCLGNTLYPWDQVSNLPSTILALPEGNVPTMVTVNQMAYVFAGNKGNIYITDGSSVSLVTTVPDYAAGIPGTESSYIQPYFTWGDAGYVRGRVYFSILDQTATKAGNCGGIWSFVPTQNFYIGQDIGMALILENENSYATYNGYATLIIPKTVQSAIGPQYFSAWQSSISSPAYGIDTSGTATSSSFTTIIETDAIPYGTMLNKQTPSQIEYKVATALANGATVQVYYRPDLTSTWTSCGTVVSESTALSGYFPSPVQQLQWFQLQVVITPVSSSTFPRFSGLRVR